MLINDFSGGMDTRISSHLLVQTKAQYISDADIVSGSIKPIKDSKFHSTLTGNYAHYFKAAGKFVSSASESSFEEYLDYLVYTQVNNYPLITDGIYTYRLGIIRPITKPTLSSIAGNIEAGTYSYQYTYYNSKFNIESQPSDITADIILSSVGGITVAGIKKSDDIQVDKIRLYRLGGTVTDYSLVATLNNTDQEYNDTMSNTDLAGNHILDSYEYKEAPDGLSYVTEHFSMMFGAIKDKLYYSAIGKVYAWPATNFIDFPDIITGIKPISIGLLVFTAFKTYLIVGTAPESFTKQLFSSAYGCSSHYSIASLGNIEGSEIIWLSHEGLCTISNGNILTLSKSIVPTIDLIVTGEAVTLDNQYYLPYSNGILVYDFRFNPTFRLLSGYYITMLSANNILYGTANNKLYEIYGGNNYRTFKWVSPIYTEGVYSIYKTYNDIYIKYEGNLFIKVYIDDKEVYSYRVEGKGCKNIKPKGISKGYSIHFKIQGTGTVQEIYYKVQGGKDAPAS